MRDELERQLARFGETLRAETGEPISGNGSDVSTSTRFTRRWWAIGGAAACIVTAVAGLVVFDRTRPDPVALPPASPSVTDSTVSTARGDDSLVSAPIAEIVDGCASDDLVVSGDFDAAHESVDGALVEVQDTIRQHVSSAGGSLPDSEWNELLGEPVHVLYLETERGIEALARVARGDDGWRVTELAHCIRASTGPDEASTSAPIDPVPDDPLGLELDGWSLVQREAGPFEFSEDEIPCSDAARLVEFDGVPEVHDILTPPDPSGLDLDVQVIDVGSIDRGSALADAILAFGGCLGESEGLEIETVALSSIRASWFRAGPEFALVTVVGEGAQSIVLEIEGARFDDELIADVAHRAARFLAGDDG